MNSTAPTSGGASADEAATMNSTKLELQLSDATIGIVSTMIFLPLAIVALRLYVRGNVIKRFEISDLFITLALLFAVVNTITVIYHCKDSMTSTDIMATATWVYNLTYWPAIWATQMGILSTCFRIFSLLGSRRAKILIWTIMGLISGYSIAGFSANLFSCRPLSTMWNASSNDHCIELPAFKIATAVITCCFDGIILLLAALSAYRTELNLRNKVYVVGILKVGFVAFLGSIGRIVAQVLIENHLGDTPHHTYIWILLPIFSALQVDLGITAASLPALAALLPSNRQAFRTRKPSDSYLTELRVGSARRPTSTPGCLKGTNTFKSIVVEREYSVKTEQSPLASRRNSFIKPGPSGDLEKGNQLTRIESLDIQEIPRNSHDADQVRQQINQHDSVENKIRAARLLGLKDEENKYLSVLNPKRWSKSKRNSTAPSDDLKIEEA